MLCSVYEVAIGMIPGIGSSHTRLLISYCGSAENVFKLTKGKLLKIPGIGEKLATSIANQEVLSKAENELKKAEANNTRLLFYTHSDYPERLKNIHDAPTLLYFKGTVNLNHPKIIGVVGTRNATDYGRNQVEKILEELIPHDVLVISGLAYGIDIAAHKAAIQNNQPTIGVMASGIDIIYPSAHKEIARKMIENGGLITEYGFHTKPDAPHFPSRNRIIAGLCDAIIVAEAASSGGALITAEIANSYNTDVFAIPGNLGNKYSEGCNQLIRNHKANILTGVKDIEYLMNWEAGVHTNVSSKERKSIDLSGFTIEEQEVLKVLHSEENILIDDLSWKAQISVSKLASILLALEFQGMVKALPGKRFKLVTAPGN